MTRKRLFLDTFPQIFQRPGVGRIEQIQKYKLTYEKNSLWVQEEDPQSPKIELTHKNPIKVYVKMHFFHFTTSKNHQIKIFWENFLENENFKDCYNLF